MDLSKDGQIMELQKLIEREKDPDRLLELVNRFIKLFDEKRESPQSEMDFDA